METAFGRALMDARNEGTRIQYELRIGQNPYRHFPVTDFLELRPDEKTILEEIQLPENAAVLDYGCGIGRHFAHLRQQHPQIHCCGVDICDLILGVCMETIPPPATFVHTLAELPDIRYDLIMLMGNGLGILGNEQDAAAALPKLLDRLAPGGCLLAESGNPFGNGYYAEQSHTRYKGQEDGPFTWGFADQQWLARQLETLPYSVTFMPNQAPGGMFYYALIRRQ